MRTIPVVPVVLCVLFVGGVALATIQAARDSMAAARELVETRAPREQRPTTAEVVAFAAKPGRDAAGWLALAARWRFPAGGDAASFDRLIAALPAPATWPAVSDGLRKLAADPARDTAGKRRAAGWALLAAALAGDVPAQRRALEDARATLGDEDWLVRHAVETLDDAEDDPQAVEKALRKRLTELKDKDDAELVVPDLVSLLGAERATPLVRSALATHFSELEVRGRNTVALAVREATARIETLASPPWSLIGSPDSLALFEALERRFPAAAAKPGKHDRPRERAEAAYLAQLVAAGRASDALARLGPAGERADRLLADLPIDPLVEQHPAALCDLLRDLLRKEPQRPLWQAYARLAAALGRSDELQALLHEHAADAARQDQLVDLLLAADEVDAAVAALRARMGGTAAADPAPEGGHGKKQAERMGEAALHLLLIGEALDRPELIAEACTAMERLPATAFSRSDATKRTLALLRTGHAALAGRLLDAELAAPAENGKQRLYLADTLAAQVRLQAATGRPDAAVATLTQAPGWRSEDLRDLSSGADLHEGVPPLALAAGEALAALGRNAEARRCALLAIEQEAGCDPAYALLLRLDPAGAPAEFARLLQLDPLEERPLIWQAQALLAAGKPDGAEALARQAVQLDPSDGDEGPGDRMRARAVLADALERLGRADEAKPLRTAIAAIRLAEHADILLRAGLATRAAAGYRASEALLDRTYCVQTRLAVTLAKLGRSAEAAEHFRRAFTLMPQAFGRRESHCFACEGAFEGGDAQRIADEVFSALAAKDPQNPRVAYLQGRLWEEQERYREAADAYRHAIVLDHDYYNAVLHLIDLDDHIRLPRAERQDLALTLARLSPGNEDRTGAFGIYDLARLYTLLLDLAARSTAPAGPVLALGKPAGDDQGKQPKRHHDDEPDTPGTQLAEHPVLRTAASLVDFGD